MKISNISYDDFFANTKAAFSKAGILDIQRDSIVRRFLNHQLFPNQVPGENESRVPSLFKEDPKAAELPTNAIVVMLEQYDNTDYGLTLTSVDATVCLDADACNRKLRRLFSLNYPDKSGESLLNCGMVTDFIESQDDEDALYQEVSEMTSDEAETWLLDNFSIDDLTTDHFFGDFLHCDLLRIRYEFSEIER